MFEYQCSKCGKIFYGDDDFHARFSRDEHEKYCILPLLHKIMKVLLSPLAIIGISVVFVGMLLFLVLSPFLYPFWYAGNLLIENEVITWNGFFKSLGLEEKTKVKKPNKA